MASNYAMHSEILGWPRSIKRLVVVAMDVGLALAATWLAFTLRLDTLHWPEQDQWLVYAAGPALAVPVFIRFGLYRAIFRYTGLAALIATAQAVAVYGALFMGALLAMQRLQLQVIPRSVGILQPLIFLLLVATSRALARFWLAGMAGSRRRADSRVLIYGAGKTGAQTAAALSSTERYALLGFVDDDGAKVGRSINGVRIHAARDLPALVARLGVTDILLALPRAARERRNDIVQELHGLPVRIRILPSMESLASGRVTVQDFRNVDIEDLLGREPVPPNPELLARNLTGKTVLVTGAGGSIGSELCRQIVRENPSHLLLLDHGEFALFVIQRELQELCESRGLALTMTPILANVTDLMRMSELFQRYRPDTVYHAAAYKHVPLVESNPAEGVHNNVFGTLAVVRASIQSKVGMVVLVSTDKAVRPTNVMGASKRIAEMILQAVTACELVGFDAMQGAPTVELANHTKFAMVRFGNVLGSSGSVVPTFRRQIAAGGPVTVTHPEVTRFFMTTPEAAQLVLQAGAMAQGGDVFLLDMGQPVKILDLAKRMVLLSGLTVRDARNPGGDIEIAVTGLRPGEKLYEELLIGNNPEPTEHPRIMKAHEDFLPWPVLRKELLALQGILLTHEPARLEPILRRLVDGYVHDVPDVAPRIHADGNA